MMVTYLQFLLGICIFHTTLQYHGPESGIIEVVDMACISG
jgi:hypothetical protein